MADNYFITIPRDHFRRQSELSKFASPREPDSLNRAWRLAVKERERASMLANSMSQTQRRIARLRRPNDSSGSTATNNWRGVWSASPTSPYMTLDIVILQSGTATGTYISMLDGNTNSPDSGIGWIQIATASGQWL